VSPTHDPGNFPRLAGFPPDHDELERATIVSAIFFVASDGEQERFGQQAHAQASILGSHNDSPFVIRHFQRISVSPSTPRQLKNRVKRDS
jgi:hypothetical protein